jgi:hypothetical protein
MRTKVYSESPFVAFDYDQYDSIVGIEVIGAFLQSGSAPSIPSYTTPSPLTFQSLTN